ncbi:hypothetical protein F751_5661 [Auxenochlorella protothecoides]|uniref:Uncharacterized protein n=1 Tax=Auxenochlorella protothecoides TaxID=3075 RepID=A0A087SPP3_AUXPR|nr:hypothetical protein F751_5661 [Auxenochlorella protothecoides]KFM27697.1 hypothetical protein F751_5661 [Auxenochlorella protothecoides]
MQCGRVAARSTAGSVSHLLPVSTSLLTRLRELAAGLHSSSAPEPPPHSPFGRPPNWQSCDWKALGPEESLTLEPEKSAYVASSPLWEGPAPVVYEYSVESPLLPPQVTRVQGLLHVPGLHRGHRVAMPPSLMRRPPGHLTRPLQCHSPLPFMRRALGSPPNDNPLRPALRHVPFYSSSLHHCMRAPSQSDWREQQGASHAFTLRGKRRGRLPYNMMHYLVREVCDGLRAASDLDPAPGTALRAALLRALHRVDLGESAEAAGARAPGARVGLLVTGESAAGAVAALRALGLDPPALERLLTCHAWLLGVPGPLLAASLECLGLLGLGSEALARLLGRHPRLLLRGEALLDTWEVGVPPEGWAAMPQLMAKPLATRLAPGVRLLQRAGFKVLGPRLTKFPGGKPKRKDEVFLDALYLKPMRAVCALAGASVGSYHDLRRGLQAELADWAATRYRGELLEGVLRGMREDIEEYESTPRNRAHLSEPGEGAPGAAGAEAEEEPAVAAQA